MKRLYIGQKVVHAKIYEDGMVSFIETTITSLESVCGGKGRLVKTEALIPLPDTQIYTSRKEAKDALKKRCQKMLEELTDMDD